jgi:hypothetical protein
MNTFRGGAAFTRMGKFIVSTGINAEVLTLWPFKRPLIPFLRREKYQGPILKKF